MKVESVSEICTSTSFRTITARHEARLSDDVSKGNMQPCGVWVVCLFNIMNVDVGRVLV